MQACASLSLIDPHEADGPHPCLCVPGNVYDIFPTMWPQTESLMLATFCADNANINKSLRAA